MNRQRILLTGDDGYNSVGTRLLIRALRDKYDLQIAATKHQQSGVGGYISLRQDNCSWGETTVDGIPALWVDGSPADVMEMAQGYFAQPFDYLISGVNLGTNVTTAVISSGTFSAAVRGMGLNLAPKGIVLSWDAPPDLYHQNHDEHDDISPYYAYPGDILRPLLDRVCTENLWGVRLVNINLPRLPSREVRFAKILKDATKYYGYPLPIDRDNHTFSYHRTLFTEQPETDLRYDAAVVNQGYIAITPCAFEMTHFAAYAQLANQQITL